MGKVTWGFTCSLDGFITGPGHDMSWMAAVEQSSLGTEDLAAAVGVIISGRAGYDAAQAQRDERDALTAEAYGGAWSGTEFVLTHRPAELAADDSVTALDCGIEEAIEMARPIAGDLDIHIISADIAAQALALDLIDELQMFTAPIFLGDGTRIFNAPGGQRISWELVGTVGDEPGTCGRIYRPRRN